MKKLISLIVLIFMICSLSFCLPKNYALAQTSEYAQTNSYMQQILNDYSMQFLDRQAGSEGEKLAAAYIKSKLDEICLESANLNALSTSSINDGVQKFTFNSVFSGLNAESQNLVYYYDSNNQTDNKIIIGCSYDGIAFDYDGNLESIVVESQSVNGSAGSVAVLLSLIKKIVVLELPYDVEFIFFGAGQSNNAGSNFYTKGILPEVKENILCMINLDSIAVGKDIYFYVDEITTNFSKFIAANFSKNNVNLKEIDTIHLGKVLLNSENELGLNYTHIAMSSNNVKFMAEGITSINIFAGDYNEGIVYGFSEFADREAITFTQNDNLDYIQENYGSNMIENNLNKSFNAVLSLLTDDSIVQQCLDSKGSTTLFYKIFANKNVIVYLSAIILIILIVVIIYIHLRFSIKSYDAKIEPEFLSSIISISQNIDETCKDENVPKAVSQILAHDIKKDKTIIVNKKNKKD